MTWKYMYVSLFFVLIFSSGEVTYAAGLGDYKAVCADIGFTPKTEKFGECVLKLSDRDKAKSAVTRQNQITNNQQIALERERQRLQQQQLAIQRAQNEASNREAKRRESQFLLNLSGALLSGGQPPRRSTNDQLDDIQRTLGNIQACDHGKLRFGLPC
jgi:hypothetical protein